MRLRVWVLACVCVVYWLGIQWAPQSPNLITLVDENFFFISIQFNSFEIALLFCAMCKNFLNRFHLYRRNLFVCVMCEAFRFIHIEVFQMLWNTPNSFCRFYFHSIFGDRFHVLKLIYFNFCYFFSFFKFHSVDNHWNIINWMCVLIFVGVTKWTEKDKFGCCCCWSQNL